jgi:hypothetical protein
LFFWSDFNGRQSAILVCFATSVSSLESLRISNAAGVTPADCPGSGTPLYLGAITDYHQSPHADKSARRK